MGLIKRKKCKHCNQLFISDARNAKRQKYCSKQECRKASKADSQRRWLQKQENQNYFSGPDQVQRVQRWRKANPGYWRGKGQKRSNTLQDSLSEQTTEIKTQNNDFKPNALQDLLIEQTTVIIGLISSFTGSALQDDIASTLIRLQQLGRDIINPLPPDKGAGYDRKTPDQHTQTAQSTQSIQLGRPPTGA
jgi:hypothetical protein